MECIKPSTYILPYSLDVLYQKIQNIYGDYLTIQVDGYIFKVPIEKLYLEVR